MDLDLLDKIPEDAGALGLLSSDEYTAGVAAFDAEMIERSGLRIGVLLCADHGRARWNMRQARAHFERLGARARRVKHGEPLPADIDLLFIGGGSPLELLTCLLNRPIGEQILEAWRGGLAVAGSSAGAMALSVHCLVPEPGADKPTTWGRGFGPLTNVGLAVHASSRARTWLEQVVATAPVPVLGMDDATGVVLTHGRPPYVVGTGNVRLHRQIEG